jgi:hypothetical protein
MTAGGGILHEEMPRRGPEGIIYGFQLWVNLPAARKLTRPRYQEVNAATIPAATGQGWRARVVAGQVDGVLGPVTEIAADPLYVEIALEPKAEFVLPVPVGQTTLAYVFEGEAEFAGQAVAAVRLAVFGEGDRIEVRGGDSPARFLLISGTPFHEPIVPYGPFVMNTRQEIQQALEDLRNGTFVRS